MRLNNESILYIVTQQSAAKNGVYLRHKVKFYLDV